MIRRAAAFGGVAATLMMTVSFLSVLVARSASTQHTAPSAQIGMPAPIFTLSDISGNSISLTELRGDVVVLMFTDPRCNVSNAYHDRIWALTQRFAHEPHVRFLAVSSRLDAGSPQHLQELRVQQRVLEQAFPTLIDTDGAVARNYGVTRTPTFHVIGPYGILRYAGAFDSGFDDTVPEHTYLQDAITQSLRGEAVLIRETRAFGCPLRPE